MMSEAYSTLITKEFIKDIPEIRIRSMYEMMLRIRLVEERVANLVSHKRIICPCHLYEGQEAVAVGVCTSLLKEDYVFSTHRSHGHYLAKGGDLKSMMAELFGRIAGCSKGRGGSMHIVAPDIGFPGSSAIVAGTIPISLGVALSFSIQGKANVSVSFFGDGAANEGVFYESLNFASLKKLPVIFVCENNFYTTHMPITAMHADIDLFKKARVFNMSSVRIDGNNVLDVYHVAKKAIEKARAGEGPALIECLTYRWRGHVGPNYDIDKGLRERSELDWWIGNCPIKRLEKFLFEEGIISVSESAHLKERIKDEIEEAVSFAEKSTFPEPCDNTNQVYK